MLAAILGHADTTSAPYRLFVGSEDILQRSDTSGVPIETINWEVGGSGDPAAFRAQHVDPAAAVSFTTHSEIRFWSVANETEFGGYLVGRNIVPAFGGAGRITDLVATDYSLILDKNVVTGISYPAGMSDQAIIQSLIGNFCVGSLGSSGAYIALTNASMPDMTFSLQSLRSALDQVAAAANADLLGERTLFVDAKRNVHYSLVAANAAPYVIHDVPTGAQRAVEGLSVDDDDSNFLTAVYIVGANAAGSGWEVAGALVSKYGWRAATLDVPDSDTRPKRTGYGQSYLATRSVTVRRGSFAITGTTGWAGDQQLTITNAGLGLVAAPFTVKHVSVEVLSGVPTLRHRIEFGARKRSLQRSLKNPQLLRR